MTPEEKSQALRDRRYNALPIQWSVMKSKIDKQIIAAGGIPPTIEEDEQANDLD